MTAFLFYAFFLFVKTWSPILPTMQLDRQQFSWKFWCVMLVTANVASSLLTGAEMRSGIRIFFFSFSTMQSSAPPDTILDFLQLPLELKLQKPP